MINVVAAIIIDNNKILIVRRSDKMKLAGMWEFPGGKIEQGESEEQCIIREIKEELNINISIHRHFLNNKYKYEFGEIYLSSYICKIENGSIKLSEHDDYKWISVNELINFKFAPADESIVKKLIEEGIEN